MSTCLVMFSIGMEMIGTQHDRRRYLSADFVTKAEFRPCDQFLYLKGKKLQQGKMFFQMLLF